VIWQLVVAHLIAGGTLGIQVDTPLSGKSRLMQGKWEVIFSGDALPANDARFRGMTISVEGNTMLIRGRGPFGTAWEERVRFEMKEAQGLVQLDIWPVSQAEKVPYQGICEVTPHIMLICYRNKPGPPRPASFSRTEDEKKEFTLLVLRRLKD
jgi:hypothetical protein